MRWAVREQFDTEQWHAWFAWRPVKIAGKWVWLETIERRSVWIACHPCGEIEWEYR